MIDRYRTYKPRRPVTNQRKRSHHKGAWFFLLILCVVFFGVKFFFSKSDSNKNNQSTTSAAQKPKPIKQADPIATTTWNDLSQKLNNLINENSDLDISIAIIDIATNTKANYGIQDNFAGASTTKVLTAAAYLHAVETGTKKLTQKIGSYTAQQHIKQMINQSNNDSWATLNQALTYATIETYAKSVGVESYKAKTNTITANDEAILLQKLYQGALLNEENTSLLLSYMQNTNNEAMIPKVLPAGATIYHKYGQLEDRLHDAAIVVNQERPIVLVIYTKGGASDGSNYQSRVQLIQSLATQVFETIYTS